MLFLESDPADMPHESEFDELRWSDMPHGGECCARHGLEQYGHEVFTATTGEQAVGMVNDRPDIELVLMDINFGSGPDGSEIAVLNASVKNGVKHSADSPHFSRLDTKKLSPLV